MSEYPSEPCSLGVYSWKPPTLSEYTADPHVDFGSREASEDPMEPRDTADANRRQSRQKQEMKKLEHKVTNGELPICHVPSWILRDHDRQAWGWLRHKCAWILEATFDGESRIFDMLIFVIISVNIVFIIMEVDQAASCEEESMKCVEPWLKRLNAVFLALYTLEMLMKLQVSRLAFFFSAWNLFDLSVVIVGYLGHAIQEWGSGPVADKVKVLQLARIARLARVLRLAKFLSRFKTLQTMLKGFGGAMSAMSYGLVVILLLILMWSILAVEFIHPTNVELYPPGSEEYCAVAFTTVLRSTLLLFQTLVAGDSWGACAIPVINAQPWLFFVFAAALVCIQLGFTNLVLAIIVDKAAEARESDKDTQLREKQVKDLRCLEKWHTMMREMDTDDSGSVSLKELIAGYDNEEMRNTLAMLNINPDELRKIFALMDTEGCGCLAYDDLTNVFFKAQTQDWRAYLMIMKLHLTRMETQTAGRLKKIETMLGDLAQVRTRERELLAADNLPFAKLQKEQRHVAPPPSEAAFSYRGSDSNVDFWDVAAENEPGDIDVHGVRADKVIAHGLDKLLRCETVHVAAPPRDRVPPVNQEEVACPAPRKQFAPAAQHAACPPPVECSSTSSHEANAVETADVRAVAAFGGVASREDLRALEQRFQGQLESLSVQLAKQNATILDSLQPALEVMASMRADSSRDRRPAGEPTELSPMALSAGHCRDEPTLARPAREPTEVSPVALSARSGCDEPGVCLA